MLPSSTIHPFGRAVPGIARIVDDGLDQSGSRQRGADPYLGGIRMPPSTRIVSPFM